MRRVTVIKNRQTKIKVFVFVGGLGVCQPGQLQPLAGGHISAPQVDGLFVAIGCSRKIGVLLVLDALLVIVICGVCKCDAFRVRPVLADRSLKALDVLVPILGFSRHRF